MLNKSTCVPCCCFFLLGTPARNFLIQGGKPSLPAMGDRTQLASRITRFPCHSPGRGPGNCPQSKWELTNYLTPAGARLRYNDTIICYSNVRPGNTKQPWTSHFYSLSTPGEPLTPACQCSPHLKRWLKVQGQEVQGHHHNPSQEFCRPHSNAPSAGSPACHASGSPVLIIIPHLKQGGQEVS